MSAAAKRAAELRRLAEGLVRIADELDPAPLSQRPASAWSDNTPNPWDVRAIAIAAYRARRERDRFFPDDLFFEPAWDMLLDLFVAECDGKKISTTSLGIASYVAPTTALRYIDALAEQDLAMRSVDPADGRRTLVAITPKGRQAMSDYLRSMRASLLCGATELVSIEGDKAAPVSAA